MSGKKNTSDRRDRANTKGDNDSQRSSYRGSKVSKALAKIWSNPLQLSLEVREAIASRIMGHDGNKETKLIVYTQQVPFVRNARNRSYTSATAVQVFNFTAALMTMLGLTLQSMVDAKSVVNVIVTIIRTLALALNQPFNEAQVKKAVQLRVMGSDFQAVSISDLIQSFGVRDINHITYGGLYGIMVKWLEGSTSDMVLSSANTLTGIRTYCFDVNVVGDVDSDAFYTAMPEYVTLFACDPITGKLEFVTMEAPDMPKNFFGTTIIRHDENSKAETMIADMIKTGSADATIFDISCDNAKQLVANGDLASGKWARSIATIDGHQDVVTAIDASVDGIKGQVNTLRRTVRKDYSPAAKAKTIMRQPALVGKGSGFNV